ncbi:MAG: rhomboid family intramembrane serine protease [Flavipsychrobacter sp.]|nr:rhomboid family intramembrane serine protease [Flavipsychrobacter sp.]
MAQFKIGLPGLTPIVKNIIIINVIVFLAQLAFKQTSVPFDDLFSLHYWRSTEFHWWQPLTHMFMHGGFAHIFFNMFALYMFGNIIENYLGGQRFLIFYLVCGLGAALCQQIFYTIQFEPAYKAFEAYQANPTLDQFDIFLRTRVPFHKTGWGDYLYAIRQSWMQDPNAANYVNLSISNTHKYFFGGLNPSDHTFVPGLFDEGMLGASGAIMGVIFAFGYLFPNALVYIFGVLPLKAKYTIIIYAAIDLFGGIQNTDDIAHFAHLGGMLFGFIMLRMWNNKKSNRIY